MSEAASVASGPAPHTLPAPGQSKKTVLPPIDPAPPSCAHPTPFQDQDTNALRWYWLATYVAVLANLAPLGTAAISTLRGAGYSTLLYGTYALLYLVPAIALVAAARLLLRAVAAQQALLRLRWLPLLLAVLAATLVQVALLADRIVFQMFAFHINGFVWNLLTTSGGVDSLGNDTASAVTYGAFVAAWLLGQTLALLLILRWAAALPRLPVRWLLAAWLLATVGERLWFGVASATADSGIVAAAGQLPLYQPMSFRHLAARAGIAVRRRHDLHARAGAGALNYPLRPLRFAAAPRPPNVVWLVAESLRADMLTPEIMPNAWQFGLRATRFTRHYSGGNGTRMGLFSMFYGLYGSYWMSFLQHERPPVLMDRVQALRYELLLQTSARFSYPEFDRTLFAAVPRAALHEEPGDLGWERDRRNVTRALTWMAARPAGQPFFYFQFFESPHARYFFPEESVIRRPYLDQLNYATMDVKRDIALIRNRYINAVHHLDQQLGRVLDGLQQQGRLADTIVIITGDHGEEFMEKGHWGHNSFFNEEQTQVPMIFYVPARAPAVVTRMTSHLDLPATLLPMLGGRSPAADYSLGMDLFGTGVRGYNVLADWDRVCIVDDDYKFVLSLAPGSNRGDPVTSRADGPVADHDAVLRQHEPLLRRVLAEMTRFRRKTT